MRIAGEDNSVRRAVSKSLGATVHPEVVRAARSRAEFPIRLELLRFGLVDAVVLTA